MIKNYYTFISFFFLSYHKINISAIYWWSVLLVEETGVPGEIHRPTASH
jgi:hypothetical protein